MELEIVTPEKIIYKGEVDEMIINTADGEIAILPHHVNLVTMSGGVSCNQELRRQLHEACSRKGLEFKNAEPWLCTDNAAMIAFAALLRLRAGFESQVTEEIDPNLALV